MEQEGRNKSTKHKFPIKIKAILHGQQGAAVTLTALRVEEGFI